MYDSERFRSASLIGAVICNSHHGMKCIDDIIFTGDIQSVVGGKVECQRPTRLTGQTKAYSFLQVRSPRSIIRNFPSVISKPTDCAFSEVSTPGLSWLSAGQ